MKTAGAEKSFRCVLLAVGDFPEGGATSQRLGLLSRLLTEGLGNSTIWLLHAASKVPITENSIVNGEVRAVKFSYLNGNTVRPVTVLGALVDTIKGIYRSAKLLVKHETRPDILILYTPRLLKFIIPILVARILRIPIITEVCEVYSFSTDVEGKGLIRRIINSGDSILELLLPRISSGLIVISGGIREYYRKLGMPDEDIYLLPVLVDTKLFERDGYDAVEFLQGISYLLNSGAFNEKDGLEYLVRAVAKVREDFPNIKLVFTGFASVDTRANISRLVGSEDCDWIIFTGYLSRQQLIWSYRHAEGLLSCRSNSDYANYGFPTKLAEYLVSGRPVVATRVGDVDFYLSDGDSAFLAEPENVDDIALAISRLLANTENSDMIGQCGAEVARLNFDYNNHVAKIGAFIRQKAGLFNNETDM